MQLGRQVFTGKLICLLRFPFAWNVINRSLYVFLYRTIGSLTNDGRKLAIFAGFYKGIQSAGAAIVWRLDSIQTPYMTILVSCWALYCGSLLVALPVILFKIPDHIDGVLPDAEP
jgi:hypothetical protein